MFLRYSKGMLNPAPHSSLVASFDSETMNTSLLIKGVFVGGTVLGQKRRDLSVTSMSTASLIISQFYLLSISPSGMLTVSMIE